MKEIHLKEVIAIMNFIVGCAFIIVNMTYKRKYDTLSSFCGFWLLQVLYFIWIVTSSFTILNS